MSWKACDIFDPDQQQILIDLETLSTRKNAVIVSIGATKFTLNDGITDKFYINVDALDGKRLGLHIDRSPNGTVEWWKKQPVETSDLWKVDPQPVKTALDAFRKWYGTKSCPTYGNSPRFDLAILESAWEAVGEFHLPWSYRDEVDFRTIAKLVPVEHEDYGVKHHALDDAIAETMALINTLKS